MFAHISNSPLAPVGAAQTLVLVGFLPAFFVAHEGVQVGALGVEVILPAGVRVLYTKRPSSYLEAVWTLFFSWPV